MFNSLKIIAVVFVISAVSGCTGSVYNKEKTVTMIIYYIQPYRFQKSSVVAEKLANKLKHGAGIKPAPYLLA